MFAAQVVAAEAAHRELPMPPWLFGVIALVAFAFLLGVTWSFRGTSQKYAKPGEGRHAHPPTPGHGDTEDAAHWPEHPGHQH